MTCIVGIETETGVILGADSMSADCGTWAATTCVEPKVFRCGAYIMGFTTSFRMGDLLRYGLTLPSPPKTKTHRHMVTVVIPAIRALFKDGGFAKTSEGSERGGLFLVATLGELYTVHEDYQVKRAAGGYEAVGCGSQLALGALSATAKMAPRARLALALEAAEKHSLGVRRPFRFISERKESRDP